MYLQARDSLRCLVEESVIVPMYHQRCAARRGENQLLSEKYSCRQKWCPEYEAGLFKAIVEHTAAKLFDAATQDRSTTDITMRVGV